MIKRWWKQVENKSAGVVAQEKTASICRSNSMTNIHRHKSIHTHLSICITHTRICTPKHTQINPDTPAHTHVHPHIGVLETLKGGRL